MRGVILMSKLARKGRFHRSCRPLVAVLSVLLMVSFAQLVQGAVKANKLLSVGLETGAETATVLIKTAEPVGYRYTIYDSFDPVRVVIDFPGMNISEMPEVPVVKKGHVQEVRVSKFDLASGSLARVEIILDESVDYQVNLDGAEFRVAFEGQPLNQEAMEQGSPEVKETVKEEKEVGVASGDVAASAVLPESKPPATAPGTSVVGKDAKAKFLTQIQIDEERAVLHADGAIGQYKTFTLEGPPRLVVDVFDVAPAFKERIFEAGSGMKQIRIGEYKDKTRIVFDGTGPKLPAHIVEKHQSEIIVAWGELARKMMQGDTASLSLSEPINKPLQQVDEKVAADKAESTLEPVLKPQASQPYSAPVAIETIDFVNDSGKSMIKVGLAREALVSQPEKDGAIVRFEIQNATISRALRRTIDASAFPSAVTSVTPYTITDGGTQHVRFAVELKGPVPYALEKGDSEIRLVIDDGAYAEPAPPKSSQVGLIAPKMNPLTKSATMPTPVAAQPTTADTMAAEAKKYTGEKITLVFDNADIRSILQLIGDVSGLNILASSDVKGTITLRLVDVPWDQALELILETAELGRIQEGNVLRIMPSSKLREREQAEMLANKEDIEVGELLTQVYPVSYSSVNDLQRILSDISSDRGSIIPDSRNKQLIIKDVASIQVEMAAMISRLDQPERQVVIEARIVEASTTFARDLGVKWNFDYENNGSQGWSDFESAALGLGGQFLIPVTNPAASGAASALSFGTLNDTLNIDLRLSALETSGEGKIISTPKVSTLNGQKAVISQGTKIPFSSTSDQGTEVEFENAELKLEVTPEINPDGSVILDIVTSNSSVGSVVPTATGNAVSIDEKKAETKVLVRDGQTTVIGGIYVESEQDGASGVPLLKDVPVLGHLFKSTTKQRERRELLIFITPRIIES